MKRSALRAQQITLGTAIFDKHGRILVDPDGLMPSVAITDSFLEKVCNPKITYIPGSLSNMRVTEQ